MENNHQTLRREFELISAQPWLLPRGMIGVLHLFQLDFYARKIV
jgi:hypothetical protein